jgi:hypothetical protein
MIEIRINVIFIKNQQIEKKSLFNFFAINGLISF